MKGKQNLKDSLEKLASWIENEVNENLSKGLIKPERELHFHWKVDSFQYTERGVIGPSAHGEYIVRESWRKAIFDLEKSINKSDAYLSVLKLMSKGVREREKIVRNLGYFIRELTSRYLKKSNANDTDIEVLMINYLKDIEGEPLKYGAEVELDGIIILGQIELKIGDVYIILRQPTIQDLEKESRVFNPHVLPFLQAPSAILNIEFLGHGSNEIQTEVEQAIAILRLFEVGSVNFTSFHMYSDSVTDILASGTLTSGKSAEILEKSQITQDDVKELKKFWQAMTKILPPSFYESLDTRVDHITISYKRYCDALLQNGTYERRIANTVMGLESLFLKGGEKQELSYRLSLRIAKILTLLGFDPNRVKEIVKNAYEIRSLFVHGDYLSYKSRKKFNGKFGDIKSFLMILLDYLRISIIIMIFLRKEKEEILDLIDESLINKDKDCQLNNLLKAPKNFIRIKTVD